MVDYASAQPERPPVPAQAPITPAPDKPAVPPVQAPAVSAPTPAPPKTAPPPQVHTEVRPYSLDEVIREAQSEAERDLDQMMKNMRQKTKPK